MTKIITDIAKLPIIASLYALLFASPAWGVIVSPKDFDQLGQQIATELDNDDNQDTLIIASFEDFIFKMDIMKYQNPPESWLRLARKKVSKLKKSSRQYLAATSIIIPEKKLRYPKMQEFFEGIASNGASMIVYTNNLSGPLGKIKNLEQWSLELLKKHQIMINFGIFADIKYEFKNLDEIDGYYPTLNNCLINLAIYAPGNSLENALVGLFQRVKYRPKKILMISSNLSEIEGFKTTINIYDKRIIFKGYNLTLPELDLKYESPQEFIDFFDMLVRQTNQTTRPKRNEKSENPYG